MDGRMPCEASCLGRPDRVVLEDCCHTCAHFVRDECRAPRGTGFRPRFLWRIVREA